MFTVLLCDDREVFRRKLKRSLAFSRPDSPFSELYEASDGQEALSFLHSRRVDVLITDIRMPVMDGLSLLKQVKARSLCPCVILLSEYAEFSYAREGLLNGAFDYLVKPVEAEQFEACMARAEAYLRALSVVSPANPQPQRIAQAISENKRGRAVMLAKSLAAALVNGSPGKRAALERAGQHLQEICEALQQATPWLADYVFFPDYETLEPADGEELIAAFTAKVEQLAAEANKFHLSPKSKLIQQVYTHILEHIEEELRIEELAGIHYVSKNHLSTKAKKETGIGLVEFITYAKIERAKILLRSGDVTIAEVAERLSFSDHNYFTRQFRKLTTLSPSDYKARYGV